MNRTEKAALTSAFTVALKAIEATPTEDEPQALNPVLTPPMIGPMFDNVSISGRLTELPFNNEEFEEAVSAIEDAIRNQNRVAGGVDTLTHVLSSVRQFLPLLLTL